jgi:pyruvate/2-oxoglutarate/acetoin dehydrogenase E1 component
MGIKSLELREVIKEITRKHLLENNGIAMGQCLTAVGWVGGTLPELYEDDGMIEISMADVAGGGFAVGAALAGKRPIYIIRYQGFNWFNAPIIINYACKSKDIWGRPCPMLIRSIAMEGGIGPVAGSSHHSIYYRMPGIKIYSPMSPNEYKTVYKEFMDDDEVYYISEHRGAYSNTDELNDIVYDKPDYVLFPISITRFAALKAAKRMLDEYDIKVSVHNIFRIKPFVIESKFLTSLNNSKYGACVLDDDYTNGIAKSIAYDIDYTSSVKIDVLGLKDKTAGFIASKDNLPPNENEIIQLIRSKLLKL